MKYISCIVILGIVLFTLISCQSYNQTISVHESYYYVLGDSLYEYVEKDSIFEESVFEDTKEVNYLMLKAGSDTIKILSDILKVKHTVFRTGDKTERTNISYELVNNKNEELAKIYIVDEDSTATMDSEFGTERIFISGNIELIPTDLRGHISGINHILDKNIKSLHEEGKQKTYSASSGDEVTK